jgi:hypothetical protein
MASSPPGKIGKVIALADAARGRSCWSAIAQEVPIVPPVAAPPPFWLSHPRWQYELRRGRFIF